MLDTPFYDPTKSYEDNFEQGPFGDFADEEVFERSGNPEHSFLGHPVYLPFGIPAGPLINGKYVTAAFKKGFDICVYKTARSRVYPCHIAPNVLAVHVDGDLTLEKASGQLEADSDYREPLSITNSFGVPSKDPAWWQEDMRQAAQSAGKGQVMVGSFQGTKPASGKPEDFVADYVQAAKLVHETGTKILEANLSCPNEGTADLLCFDVERVGQIADQIKNEIGDTPLLLKLAYFKDNEHLRRLVKRVGGIVQGLSVINTIPSTIVDQNGQQALPGEGRARSGVCGAAIKWAGLEMVDRLKQLRDELGLDFVIVGVGGVTQPKDYQQYRSQGADAVMSATGAMWHPHLAQEIWQLEQE